jgi:hypothetical protein
MQIVQLMSAEKAASPLQSADWYLFIPALPGRGEGGTEYSYGTLGQNLCPIEPLQCGFFWQRAPLLASTHKTPAKHITYPAHYTPRLAAQWQCQGEAAQRWLTGYDEIVLGSNPATFQMKANYARP